MHASETTGRQPSVRLSTRVGREVTVRHIRPDDAALLEEMFYKLSPETRWRRFFVPLEHVDPALVHTEAARLATIDPRRETALIATAWDGDHEAAVAVARYAALDAEGSSAECAIVVRDDFQGVGLGFQLLELLVQTALAHGVRHLVMLTHADNHGMIALVRHLGLPYHGHFSSGLYEIDLQLADADPPAFTFTSARPAQP